MSEIDPEFKIRSADENVQIAEAFDVVSHAVKKMHRGGARGGRRRSPSMNYSASRSRNPRECLRRAYEDLGFASFDQAKLWIEGQPIDRSKKLELNIKPKPRNLDLNFPILGPYVQLDYPTRLQSYLSHLNQYSLADVRPLVFGVRDAEGRTSRLIMKIMSDPRPDDQESLILDGRLVMKRYKLLSCLNGETHAIFPGHMARLHIDPAEDLRHVEFLTSYQIEDRTQEGF